MTTRVNPPSLTKSKNYERFKQEVLAWSEITELKRDKQGIAVVLSLPEEDENQIKDKVFDQIPVDDLKDDSGLDILLAFLDKHLGKDDLADSLDKFEDFDEFSRKDGQSIQEYIAMFDSKYRKVEKKSMALPSEILAFKLIKKANITKEEKMLVLTGMNFENKLTLSEEAKASLKKFKGDKICTNENQAIKLEPAYLAENEEVLLAAGYVKSKPSRRFNNRTGTSCDHGCKGPANTRSRENTCPRAGRSRKMNAVGSDGQIMTCKCCGSFRHLIADCPDSWENMAKLSITDDENIVL